MPALTPRWRASSGDRGEPALKCVEKIPTSWAIYASDCVRRPVLKALPEVFNQDGPGERPAVGKCLLLSTERHPREELARIAVDDFDIGRGFVSDQWLRDRADIYGDDQLV